MSWIHNRDKKYTEKDEIGFLRELAVSSPARALAYSLMILRGDRCYDPGVSVGKVRAEATRLLAVLRSNPASLSSR